MRDKQITIKVISPVTDKIVRTLCLRPYYNHPKGCPNYNKKSTCPPNAPLWDKIIDMNLSMKVLFTRFDIKSHREKMLRLHPNWSIRQAECCLYWQSKARKPLKDYIRKYKLPGELITICPEAMGINVTETMKQIGIELEWPPKNWTYQIAMAGWLL